jgi:MYXO-CTERM domain-containing protein
MRVGFLVLCCCLMAGTLSAGSIVVAFPAAGDQYLSQTNGSGVIPAGGMAQPQWTAGDSVTSAVFAVPGSYLTGLTENWTYRDYLNGATETWNILVNGVVVGSETLPDCNYCAQDFTLTNTLTFAGIAPVGGGYQISLVLQNTVPDGRGSAAWLDGGTTTLTTDGEASVPEPAGMLPLGLALLAGLPWIRRRFLR